MYQCIYAHKYTKDGPEVVHYGEKPVVAALVVLNAHISHSLFPWVADSF